MTKKKQLAIHSGCDPTNSEKIGMITAKMPIRILEKRETTVRQKRASKLPRFSCSFERLSLSAHLTMHLFGDRLIALRSLVCERTSQRFPPSLTYFPL